MNTIALILLICFSSIYCNLGNNGELQTKDNPEYIKLPPGFHIEVYADNVKGARSLALSSSGILFVATRDVGAVYAVIDSNKDFAADEVITVAKGLNMPNGVALKNGDLFVAEVNRVIKFSNIEANLKNSPAPVIVNDNFPSDRHHGWKFIRFGPDDKLYVPVGAPCNVCLKDDKRYATIMRMNIDGSNLEVFASGIRNSVGFDWHPVTKQLWFTDNGRDLLGDDIPPDELNRAYKQGLNFGFPFLHGKNILDPEFGVGVDTSEFEKPAQELGPHVASLGMRFYTGKMFPAEYQNQIFIAEHGSWNRTEKIGYRISLVKLNGNIPVSYSAFASGWLNNQSVSGRPVDLEIMPDGSLLVSDDFADKIYRIYYKN